MSGEMRVVLPPRDVDRLSEGLRALTAAIGAACPELERGYGLGGEDGYGADFENDTFRMHHFCWCGSDDCPWCSYSGEEGAHFQEKNRQFGALPDHGDGVAPNFIHKASGYRVWWYKWIGRDNEVYGQCDIDQMINECISSLSLPAP